VIAVYEQAKGCSPLEHGARDRGTGTGTGPLARN